jgi:RloB-like protein
VNKRKDLAQARPRLRPYRPKERRKRFLLYCDGEVTEPNYFTDFARFLRSQLIEVEIAPERRKDPKRLFELALARRAEADREAKRERDLNLRYDEVWIVFDCDDRPGVTDVVRQAESNGLGTAFSNPCFELWLLLHFQDHYSFVTTKQAQAAVRRHVPAYVKHMEYTKLEGKAGDALKRAARLESTARENGHVLGNPTTSVWQLIVRLCEDSRVPVARI